MTRRLATCAGLLIALYLTLSAQAPPARATGNQHREYVFSPTGQRMPYRVYVPNTWDGKASLPILLMLHGAGANENTYMDQANGLLMKLAEQHGFIVVSPIGFTPLGAYGNPLRLPAVFGQTAAAASQRAAVTATRQRELDLSELEVIMPSKSSPRSTAPIARAPSSLVTRWAAGECGISRRGIRSAGARSRRCRDRLSTRQLIRSIASNVCPSS